MNANEATNGPQGEGSSTGSQDPRPASPAYDDGRDGHDDVATTLQPTVDSNGKCPGQNVDSIRDALAGMYQCFRAAQIPVHSVPSGQPITEWRKFARRFENLSVDPNNEEELEKIVAKIHKDGRAKLNTLMLLRDIQRNSGFGATGGRGDREQSVGPASRTSSSAGGPGKRPLQFGPETPEERAAKRAAQIEAASKAEAANNLAAIERDAALFAAEQRGVGDSKLLERWSIEVKVLKPELEAAALATNALVMEVNELVRTVFVCNNASPDLLPAAKFANLALITNPDDSPAPADLLLRERLSAVIASVRRIQPLAVRAGAQARRVMAMYHLMYLTMGADAWTCRQVQSREVADEHRLPLDVHHQALRTWEEKIRSALIHVDQRGAFLPGATMLRGPVDHLVQAHLARRRLGGHGDRAPSGDNRSGGRGGQTGSCGGNGGGRPRRAPKVAGAKSGDKPADKRRKRPVASGDAARKAAKAAEAGGASD